MNPSDCRVEEEEELFRRIRCTLDVMRGGRMDWEMMWNVLGRYEQGLLVQVSDDFWRGVFQEYVERVQEAFDHVWEPCSQLRCASVSTDWKKAWKTIQLICSLCTSEKDREQLREQGRVLWENIIRRVGIDAIRDQHNQFISLLKHLNGIMHVAFSYPFNIESDDVEVALGLLRITIFHYLSNMDLEETIVGNRLEHLYFYIRRMGLFYKQQVFLSIFNAVLAITEKNDHYPTTFATRCKQVHLYVRDLDCEEASIVSCNKMVANLFCYLVEHAEWAQLISSPILVALINCSVDIDAWPSIIQELLAESLTGRCNSHSSSKIVKVCFLITKTVEKKEVKSAIAMKVATLLTPDVLIPSNLKVEILKHLPSLYLDLEEQIVNEFLRNLLSILLYDPSTRIRRGAILNVKEILHCSCTSQIPTLLTEEIVQVCFLKARDVDPTTRNQALTILSNFDAKLLHRHFHSSDWQLLLRHGYSDKKTSDATDKIFVLYLSDGGVIEHLEQLDVQSAWKILKGPLKRIITAQHICDTVLAKSTFANNRA